MAGHIYMCAGFYPVGGVEGQGVCIPPKLLSFCPNLQA